jgi:hypothetical protein
MKEIPSWPKETAKDDLEKAVKSWQEKIKNTEKLELEQVPFWTQDEAKDSLQTAVESWQEEFDDEKKTENRPKISKEQIPKLIEKISEIHSKTDRNKIRDLLINKFSNISENIAEALIKQAESLRRANSENLEEQENTIENKRKEKEETEKIFESVLKEEIDVLLSRIKSLARAFNDNGFYGAANIIEEAAQDKDIDRIEKGFLRFAVAFEEAITTSPTIKNNDLEELRDIYRITNRLKDEVFDGKNRFVQIDNENSARISLALTRLIDNLENYSARLSSRPSALEEYLNAPGY